MSAAPKTRQLSIFPLQGFVNSVPRKQAPFAAFVEDSINWLVGNQRLLRRSGSTTVKNGVLESSWGALARRLVPAKLLSLTNGFAAPLVFFANEARNAATLCFRSTNTTPATWRTVGQEFSSTHYPITPGVVPTHRVVPLVYLNAYGSLTLHRLNRAIDREHLCGLARAFLQVGTELCWPGYTPARWNSRFNDATGAGTESCEVFPLGLIPPLQMPVVTAGNYLGGAKGPWLGTDCWYFTVCFENTRGELSMYAIPRPPGSAWTGYPGFGYVQVDATNAAYYYDAMIYSNIPQGPPGTAFIHLLRTTKVSAASSSVATPDLGTLSIFATVAQGVKSYADTNGNDGSLNADPRIADMVDGGLKWPNRAKYMARYDGHALAGLLNPNPMALIIAPWNNGALNCAITDAALYTSTMYFVGVLDAATLYLRVVTAGTPVDTTIALAGMTLRSLIDRLNSDASYTTTAFANCDYSTSQPYALINTNATPTGILIGDDVVSADFPAGTTVLSIGFFLGADYILVSNRPTATNTAQTVTFRHRTGGTAFTWGAQVVPGADADQVATFLAPTFSSLDATYTTASAVLTSTIGTPPAYVLGMTIDPANTDFTPGTTVTGINGTAITVSAKPVAALNSGTSFNVGFDTGDTILAQHIGMVRAYGNAWPAVLPWSKVYTDQFNARFDAMTFTAGTPGYAANGINTWMERNDRDGTANFGDMMGFADMGPVAYVFFARGRTRFWNQRTGVTHADEDYNVIAASYTRGLRSPYCLCAGNQWCVFLSDEGLFVVGVQLSLSALRGDIIATDTAEVLLSKNIYDAERPAGQRGELEASMNRCLASSESGGDDFPLLANVEGGVLYLNYQRADNTRWQIRYDFSMGSGRTGIAEVLQDDGTPYPWSCPLNIGPSCSAKIAESDGHHHYAAFDGNTGATDGRVDEINSVDQDNGVLVNALGDTGPAFAAGLALTQPTVIRSVMSKNPPAGLSIGVALNPEVSPSDLNAQFSTYDLGQEVVDDFGRTVVQTDQIGARGLTALALRIADDGTGPPPEFTQLRVDATDTAAVVQGN